MVYKVGMTIVYFCTHVSNVLPNSLSLHQRGDPEAVVPVATAEEQLAIMGDHKQRCCDLHAWGKRFGQKFLGSCMKTGGRQYIQKIKLVRELRVIVFNLHMCCSHLVLDTVGSLMKVK